MSIELKSLSDRDLLIELHNRGYAVLDSGCVWSSQDVEVWNQDIGVDMTEEQMTECMEQVLCQESVVQFINESIYDYLLMLKQNGGWYGDEE